MSAHNESSGRTSQQAPFEENPEKRLHRAYLWAKSRGDITYSMAQTGGHKWDLHIRCDFNTDACPEVILTARSEKQLKTLIKTLFPRAMRLKDKFAHAVFPSYPSAAIVRVWDLYSKTLLKIAA